MRAMIGAVVGATPRLPRAKSKGGRPRECEAMPLVYPQPRTRAGTLPRPYVGVALCGLLACGPGNVAQDDDAQGDDDAFTDDDATVGDDDVATGGTGTISVTVEVLAVLQEGQTVAPEIVVDGTPTGVFAPAEIEAPAGSHSVTLKANEPGAPVAQRFVAAPHEVTVARDGTVACPMFLGRDLTGTWQPAEDWPVPNDDPQVWEMRFGEYPYEGSPPSPCPSAIWADGLCLLPDDRLWMERDGGFFTIQGAILDNGNRIEYTVDDGPDGGVPEGPWVLTRVEE